MNENGELYVTEGEMPPRDVERLKLALIDEPERVARRMELLAVRAGRTAKAMEEFASKLASEQVEAKGPA